MKLAILAILLGLTFDCFAQSYSVIDSTIIKCSYEYIELEDTLKTYKRNDLIFLEIGSKCSKSYSYYTFRFDSLRSTPKGHKELSRQIVNFGKNYLSKDADLGQIVSTHPFYRLSTCVYKNYPEGKMTVTDFIVSNDYLYEDSLDIQKWTLSEDSTKNILGYECQQASCDFRGRQWTAWFALGIPVNEGPWKFRGLPGLIMEVYDRGEQEHFIINGIEQKVFEPIYYGTIGKDINKFEKTTFTKFLKASYDDFRTGSSIFKEQIGLPSSENKYIPRRDFLEREEDTK